jgi:anti-sigma B factor antagonist
MHLHIEQRENEGIAILDLKGRLLLGPEDAALRQHLQDLQDAGHENVALNFKEVSQMDSSALGTLIDAATKFREAAGRLVLFNVSPAHTELSDMVKLTTDFEIYGDEISAVNSFFPDRAIRHYDILEFVEELEQKRHETALEPGTSAGKKPNG